MTGAGARTARLSHAPRRGLSRMEAAIYIGVGATKFDAMVADGRMPQPKRIDGRKVWDIRALDLAFEDLPDDGPARNSWDDISTDFPSTNAGGERRRGHHKRPIAFGDDPEAVAAVERLSQQFQLHRYEPGEWEAEIRGRAMGKRELDALGEFYRHKDGPLGRIKGAGLDTAERLQIRGYIAVAEEHGDRVPYYRITPDGEAAWLTIANSM